MKTRNIIGIVLLIVALGCLFPGLYLPILTLEIGAQLPIVGKLQIYDETQSILQTIQNLYNGDNALTATLILLFSVVVPFVKVLLLLLIAFFRKMRARRRIHRIIGVIGKWSMADVFVTGIFIAYLGTRSNSAVAAEPGSGFYWFLAYCLLSIAGTQITAFGVEDER